MEEIKLDKEKVRQLGETLTRLIEQDEALLRQMKELKEKIKLIFPELPA